MFVKIGLVLLAASLLQSSRACDNDGENVDQPVAPNYYDPYRVSASQWLYNYYYNGQPKPIVPSGFNAVAIPINPQLSGFYDNTRQAVTPSATSYETCSSPNREMGICAPSATCTRFGGRASGSCTLGRVCCINTVNSCDQTVTLNNTYWTSPISPVSATDSTCGLTVKLDARIAEQRRTICQVRLDFVVFSISQPDTESVCSTDTFDVAGANNKVPVICGDNDGQHMYLNVPPSTIPTDLQLTFSFGSAGTSPRVWNVLVSMLPCDAINLAPQHCLQFFTTRTGRFSSFNWRDATGALTRQLANQDYSICFRTTSGSNTRICFTACPVTTATEKTGFSLSLAKAVADGTTNSQGKSQGVASDCNNDYLVIPGGFNSANPTPVANMAFDRYCGERLNALPNAAASSTVCTTVTPFRVVYRTNGDETTTTAVDTAANGNRGFCLSFQQ